MIKIARNANHSRVTFWLGLAAVAATCVVSGCSSKDADAKTPQEIAKFKGGIPTAEQLRAAMPHGPMPVAANKPPTANP